MSKITSNVSTAMQQHHLNDLENAQLGIAAASMALREILLHRNSPDCPEWCKNNFMTDGLIVGIEALSANALNLTDDLKTVVGAGRLKGGA